MQSLESQDCKTDRSNVYSKSLHGVLCTTQSQRLESRDWRGVLCTRQRQCLESRARRGVLCTRQRQCLESRARRGCPLYQKEAEPRVPSLHEVLYSRHRAQHKRPAKFHFLIINRNNFVLSRNKLLFRKISCFIESAIFDKWKETKLGKIVQ
jgi:hypothetical protein